LTIVADNLGGIRHSDLLKRVHERTPETPFNSIRGALWNLDAIYPSKVKKPTRGLFIPADSAESVVGEESAETTQEFTPQGKKISESEFYQPFAEWLKADLDEVTTVAALGGAGLGSKWGTPDVVGAYKPLASHLIKFDLEIVSAEIKIDKTAP